MSRRHAEKQNGAAGAANKISPALFGPQSQWSLLLVQREHLQNEIHRGRKCLEQLRTDLAECGALVEGWPAFERATCRPARYVGARSIGANDSMETFLTGWLDWLEDRLGAVNRGIDAFEIQTKAEPVDPEESLFALLRAAG